jgi:hypothetical protein
MSNSTPNPSETQLNFESILQMLNEHLASYNLAIGETGEGWAILDISNPHRSNIIDEKPTQLEAYKTSLNCVTDMVFNIALDSGDEP